METFNDLWGDFIDATPSVKQLFKNSDKMEILCKLIFAAGATTLVKKVIDLPPDQIADQLRLYGLTTAAEGIQLGIRMQRMGGSGGAAPDAVFTGEIKL